MDYRFKFDRKKPAEHERTNHEREERDRFKRMRGLAIGLSIPMTLIGGPVAGWLIGSWLDHALGTGFWMVVMIVLGTAAGFCAMIEMLIKLGREQ